MFLSEKRRSKKCLFVFCVSIFGNIYWHHCCVPNTIDTSALYNGASRKMVRIYLALVFWLVWIFVGSNDFEFFLLDGCQRDQILDIFLYFVFCECFYHDLIKLDYVCHMDSYFQISPTRAIRWLLSENYHPTCDDGNNLVSPTEYTSPGPN